MQTTINSYRDLRVWQMAMELAVECYAVTKAFPNSELYGITSQIRRSVASVAANIAEGHGRDNRGSFVQFLRIAQGSLKETETHRVGLLSSEILTLLISRSDEIGKMLRSLIRNLQQKGDG